MNIDHNVRIAAFNWLSEQVAIHGDVLPLTLLKKGFTYQNKRVHLVSRQGIFKPKILDLPLTITTSPKGPYDDSFGADSFLLYKYRGTDSQYVDNVGLRKLMKQRKPLIYFLGVIPGKYMPVWPVFIIDDDPKSLTFTVAVDDLAMFNNDYQPAISDNVIARREYITATVKARLHQRGFREKVLDAYRTQCALCRLRHIELLDAAHIIPDNEPDSRPTVDNGLALCKLHHAAFDSFLLGITPDYKIEVRKDILTEKDGPMLQHGLIGLHAKKIILPSRENLRPNQEFLDRRYQKFINVA